MSYTKEPWEVIQRAVDGETHVVSVDGYFIANCGHTSKDERLPYNREALANARLIAAAPDLLEVTDIALDIVQHVLYLHPDDEVAQAQKVIIEQARAKAEGGER